MFASAGTVGKGMQSVFGSCYGMFDFLPDTKYGCNLDPRCFRMLLKRR